MKISEYSEVTLGNYHKYKALIYHDGAGTRLLDIHDAILRGLAWSADVNAQDVSIQRNNRNIFRGKNLGPTVTANQQVEIYNGTFRDLYIGDYWTGPNEERWVIVDFDYWYNVGDTADTKLKKHHLVIMPLGSSSEYVGRMNYTDVTTGGYVGSKMYTEGLTQIKNDIANLFGGLVLTHREYLSNETTNGYVSGGAWYDSTVDLPNEFMIYGCRIHSGQVDVFQNSNVNLHTSSPTQLSYFRLAPRQSTLSYWLRDVVSGKTFASVQHTGMTAFSNASAALNIRPVFALGPSERPVVS